MSPRRAASSRSKRAARSRSRACGTISLSTKSRAVSWIRRCSSLRSRSTAGRPRGSRRRGSQRLLQGALERLRRLTCPRPGGLQLVPVDRRDGLNLAYGRGEERLPCAKQVLDLELTLLGVEGTDYLGA